MAVPEKTQYIRIRYRDTYQNRVDTVNIEIANETEFTIYGYAINRHAERIGEKYGRAQVVVVAKSDIIQRLDLDVNVEYGWVDLARHEGSIR